jgi:transposase-like protein
MPFPVRPWGNKSATILQDIPEDKWFTVQLGPKDEPTEWCHRPVLIEGQERWKVFWIEAIADYRDVVGVGWIARGLYQEEWPLCLRNDGTIVDLGDQRGSMRYAPAFPRSDVRRFPREYVHLDDNQVVEILRRHNRLDLWLLTPPANPKPKHSGEPRGEKNRAVREYLEDHPNATSTEIARKLKCSDKTVRGTAAWRNRAGIDRREAKSRRVTERPLTEAMHATIPGQDLDPAVIAADRDEAVSVARARYMDTLDARGRAEFNALKEPDQLDRLGEFLANEGPR